MKKNNADPQIKRSIFEISNNKQPDVLSYADSDF